MTSAVGTEIDWTGIPAGTKKVTLMLVGVSMDNNLTEWLLQIGHSGGIEDTGYVSSGSFIKSSTAINVRSSTAGFIAVIDTATSDAVHGTLTLSLADASTNTWTLSGTVLMNTTTTSSVAGSKSLPGVLDRIRLTTAATLDKFDAGSAFISVE